MSGRAHAIITKIHRICAIFFLLSILPAGYASAKGGEPVAFVYLPLPFLFALVITGTYQLVRPWVVRARARRQA